MFMLPFLLFFMIANPLTYKMTRKVFGGIASPEGLPTQVGVLLHAFVFVMLLKFVLKRLSQYTPGHLNPGTLNGGSSANTGYISLTHQKKTKN